MADDRSLRSGQDRTRVNVNPDHELRYWTHKWGVSRDELRAAVAKVGPMVADLERHFASSSTSRSRA
jgi:hypothetical protein